MQGDDNFRAFSQIHPLYVPIEMKYRTPFQLGVVFAIFIRQIYFFLKRNCPPNLSPFYFCSCLYRVALTAVLTRFDVFDLYTKS